MMPTYPYLTDRPLFVMLVGIQGSGKTSAAKRIHEDIIGTGRICEIIGADLHIEAETGRQGRTYNDVYNFPLYQQAKNQADSDARRLAKSLSSVIWDATSITVLARKERIRFFSNSVYSRVAVCLPVSLERALANNRLRYSGRVIPDNVVCDSSKRLQLPSYKEGFDLIVRLPEEPNAMEGAIARFVSGFTRKEDQSTRGRLRKSVE